MIRNFFLSLAFFALPLVAGPPAKKLIEQPARLKGVPERIVDHKGFRLSFNSATLCPNWVAWELTAAEAKAEGPRYNYFEADPALPPGQQVVHADYKASGYDRGHMCPAADMKWDSRAQRECFYMSNMCPQNPSLNSGSWKKLEEACRRWAKREGSVYVVAGPVFKPGKKVETIGRNVKISVPHGFYRVVLSLRKGKEKAIAFYYENRAGRQAMHRQAMSVDDLERMLQMDFYPQLEDALERRLEREMRFEQWQ